MKLKLSDIEILNEGKQARKLIIEKYGSLKKFVEDSNMLIHSNSLESYLSRGNITSDSFKYHLTVAFDTSYDRLILDKKGQIMRYVDLVYDNIKEYRGNEDIEVMDRLRDMCRTEKLTAGEAKMQRNAAMYHFYRGDHITAIELLKIGIELLADRHEDNLILSMLSELGLVYFYAQRYEKAESVFREIEFMLERARGVEDKTLVLYYFRRGVLYNNTGRHKLAVEMFERSLGYSRERYDVGVALMNVGIAFIRIGKYKKAIGYLKKALTSFDENDLVSKSNVYNNMADLYKLQGKYDTALKMSELALQLSDKSNISNYFTCYYTYCEIKMLQDNSEEILYELLNLLRTTDNVFIYRKFLLEYIDTILTAGINNKYVKVIKQLEEVLTNAIENTDCKDKDYVQALKAYLGDIYLFNKRGGVKIMKKKIFSIVLVAAFILTMTINVFAVLNDDPHAPLKSITVVEPSLVNE